MKTAVGLSYWGRQEQMLWSPVRAVFLFTLPPRDPYNAFVSFCFYFNITFLFFFCSSGGKQITSQRSTQKCHLKTETDSETVLLTLTHTLHPHTVNLLPLPTISELCYLSQKVAEDGGVRCRVNRSFVNTTQFDMFLGRRLH